MKFINLLWKLRKAQNWHWILWKRAIKQEIIHLRPEYNEKQLCKHPRFGSTGEIQLFISSQVVRVLCKRSNKLEKTNERDRE